ncbi:unnamed protein product [Sphagnum jensenii]|uniref:Uncharacterized protein n=1 Tax=Sphagnum jensenii TaxID=128206 RepID=A0ABP0WXQ6_9BRYO
MVSEGVDTVVVEGAATLASVGEQQSLPDCLHIDVHKRKFKIQTNNLHQPACALLVAMMGIYVMKLVPVSDIAPNLMGPLEKRHSSESPVLNYQICIDMLIYVNQYVNKLVKLLLDLSNQQLQPEQAYAATYGTDLKAANGPQKADSAKTARAGGLNQLHLQLTFALNIMMHLIAGHVQGNANSERLER